MSVLVAILGLAFLILIHEAGHFFTALAVGMRPRSFNIGFGPPLAKVRRGGIDYAVRAFPLGGYVKIPGMHRPAPQDVDIHFGRALRESPELVGPTERLKRALSAGDADAARAALAEIDRSCGEQGVPPGVDKGIQEILDGLSAQAYWRQRTWKRVAAILAGPATNLAFAILLFAIVFMVAGGRATTTVQRIVPGHDLARGLRLAPAAQAGLRPGDRVLAINGEAVTASQITERISSSKGRPLTLAVLRGREVVILEPVRPIEVEPGVYRLGFQLHAEPLGLGAAAWKALRTTGVVARETAVTLAGIFHKKERQQIGGTVSIFRASKDAAQVGWASYLGVLGFISLSLALLNLLPLLPLDGGHIAFSLLEGIRGRAIAREIYERVSAVGIAVVLLLFFVGLSNDVGRLGG
ncbi:MAG TPA: M50 family metallopeptidase [Gaiellaceae bacterium]|nr:M50 family metallopeptidase [Gaiellaceae bacterium]